jgi:hypothetical protein
LALGYTLFFAAGELVDLHQALFPFSMGRQGYYLGVWRLSGFFIEPGTYSQWMYMLVLLRIALGGSYLNLTNTVAVLSCILTFSAWAIIAALFFASSLILHSLGPSLTSERRTRVLLGIAFLAIAFIASYVIFSDTIGNYFEYIWRRYDQSDSMNRVRFDGLYEFTSRLPEVILFGNPISDPVCRWCLAPEDIGLWSSFTYHFGLAPTVILGAILVFRLLARRDLALLAAFVPFAFTKAQFYEPLAWMLITVAIGLAGTRQPERRGRHDLSGVYWVGQAGSAGSRA